VYFEHLQVVGMSVSKILTHDILTHDILTHDILIHDILIQLECSIEFKYKYHTALGCLTRTLCSGQSYIK